MNNLRYVLEHIVDGLDNASFTEHRTFPFMSIALEYTIRILTLVFTHGDTRRIDKGNPCTFPHLCRNRLQYNKFP